MNENNPSGNILDKLFTKELYSTTGLNKDAMNAFNCILNAINFDKIPNHNFLERLRAIKTYEEFFKDKTKRYGDNTDESTKKIMNDSNYESVQQFDNLVRQFNSELKTGSITSVSQLEQYRKQIQLIIFGEIIL